MKRITVFATGLVLVLGAFKGGGPASESATMLPCVDCWDCSTGWPNSTPGHETGGVGTKEGPGHSCTLNNYCVGHLACQGGGTGGPKNPNRIAAGGPRAAAGIAFRLAPQSEAVLSARPSDLQMVEEALLDPSRFRVIEDDRRAQILSCDGESIVAEVEVMALEPDAENIGTR
jgi:hypothetical protein